MNHALCLDVTDTGSFINCLCSAVLNGGGKEQRAALIAGILHVMVETLNWEISLSMNLEAASIPKAAYK